MPRIQEKITNHTTTQENHSWSAKRQSTDVNSEKNQLLELLDKDFKAIITKIFQLSITNSVDTNEKKSQQRNGSYKKESNGKL